MLPCTTVICPSKQSFPTTRPGKDHLKKEPAAPYSVLRAGTGAHAPWHGGFFFLPSVIIAGAAPYLVTLACRPAQPAASQPVAKNEPLCSILIIQFLICLDPTRLIIFPPPPSSPFNRHDSSPQSCVYLSIFASFSCPLCFTFSHQFWPLKPARKASLLEPAVGIFLIAAVRYPNAPVLFFSQPDAFLSPSSRQGT